MFCSCFHFRDFVSGEILESERIKDRREKDREGGGEATERDETGLVGGFVLPRTHADVPQSASAGRRC